MGVEPLPGGDKRTYKYEVPESGYRRRGLRLVDAEAELQKATRRYRVAEARLDRLSEEAALVDGVTALGFEPSGIIGGLEGRVDQAYERIAEAKVDLDDALAHRNPVQAEESGHDSQR